MKVVLFQKDQFLSFCKLVDEANHFDFAPDQFHESGSSCRYETVYRDSNNYKSPVTFRLDDGAVSWDVQYGWEDAYEEIEELYRQFVSAMLESEGVLLAERTAIEKPIRLYCPRCGSKAAEPSGDSFHLDPERFEEDNQYDFEGRVDRFVCNCCSQDFYLPEE